MLATRNIMMRKLLVQVNTTSTKFVRRYEFKRYVSQIAREIITGNDSCLIGEWNSNNDDIGRSESSSMLLLMHHHLVGLHKDHSQSFNSIFESLLTKLDKDKWSEYDQLLFSACKCAIKDGDYLGAAINLESISCKLKAEPVILKLTQDFYILAGRSDLLLKTIIRYPSCFHASDDFRPSIFGMLGNGYAELGQFQEADEIARKSRAMSTEVDVNLIATIIDGHNLFGKSSEVKTVMDEELIKYRNLGGLSLMQCGQATSQLMRGNVNFAYNELVSILDVDNNNNKATHDADFVYNMPVLLKSSMLLLQVIMNLSPKHFMELDRLANLLQHQLRMHDSAHRYHSFLQLMILSTHFIALDTMNHSRFLTSKPIVQNAPSTSLWASIFGSFKPKRRASISSVNASSSINQPVNDTESISQSDGSVSIEGSDIQSSPLPRDVEIERSHQKLNLLAQQMESKLDWDNVILPLLPTTDASDGLSCLYPKSPTAVAALSFTPMEGMNLLAIAIANFATKNYEKAVQILALLYHRNYGDLGLRVAQRDVVHQLFIESLLRNNQLYSAKILLIERTVLVPNDGQTWRRLGIVHGLLGQQKESEEANYTAWQLGIGQGGYGGAE
jgi:tetratricopeptide (TPR) repeat protein